MRRPLLAAAFVSLSMTGAISSQAHQEKVPQPPIDCDGAPADAVLQLPPPAGYWLRVICTERGHTLAPISGDAWQIIQDERELTIAAADDPANTVGRHGSYFVAAEVRELGATDGAAARELFGATADPSLLEPARQTYVLQLVDNHGGKDSVYIFLDDQGPIAGVACINTCDKTVTVSVIHPEVEPVEP